MAQGPVVPKRTLVGGPPSGLPDKPLEYPGKPLSRRFNPLEQTRKFEEPKPDSPNKMAVSTPFTPVSSIPFPDKNVHIAPVSNMQPRGLQPVGIRGTVLLPVGGSGLYDLSDEISGPLEARLGRVTEVPKKPLPEISPQPEKQFYPRKPSALARPTVTPEILNTELENLRKIAREELAKREGRDQPATPPITSTPVQPLIQVSQPAEQPKTAPTPTQILENQAVPTVPETAVPLPPPQQVQKPPLVSEPTSQVAIPSQPLSKPEEETQRLLAEAEKLETQLSQLREGITTSVQVAQETKEAAEAKQVPDQHPAQIDNLEAEKTRLQTQVNSLETSSNEELQKRRSLEGALETQASDFKRQLQHTQIEKTNFLGRIKKLEEQGPQLEKQQAQEKKHLQEISDLKSQVADTLKERDKAYARLQKLEALVKEIGSKEREAAVPPAHAVKPEQAKEPKEGAPSTKIVKPQIAIGKMAPALTSAPNVINGIVKDPEGMLLPGIIIVVKDSSGQPVRALKTNKIGQFAISTPLPNGTYTMELESEEHNFDIVEVEVEGKVMRPVEIRAAG